MSILTVRLDPERKQPYYFQLYQAILQEIQNGGLAAGEKLPSKRTLAQRLSVSVNTVDSAYQMLTVEGYLRAADRSGFYVQPLARLTPPAEEEPLCPPPAPQPSCEFNCAAGSVDTDAFPFETWSRLSRSVMYRQPQLLHYGDPQGDLELRQVLCRYLRQARGVRCRPEQMIIGAGMEYLLMALCCLLPEDTLFAMEEPGYPKAAQAVRNSGRRLVHIPLEGGGMSAELLEQSGAQCAYLTPSHQFPTGSATPAGRRSQLLQWAAAAPGRYLIEDDYDSEFRYSGRPIPALQGADRCGQVIYCGTFSRSIAPSIRIAYLALPPSLLPLYRRRFSLQSSTVSRFEQHTLGRFIQEGFYERHLNRTRNLYKKRRDLLIDQLKQTAAGPWIEILGAEAGLHLLLRLTNGLREEEMLERARGQGVALTGLSAYYQDPTLAPEAHVLCGYAHIPQQKIPALAQALGRAWTI